MSDIKPQVFLRDEVITREDLIGIRNGFAVYYDEAEKEGDDLKRYKHLVAVNTIQMVIDYLDGGKRDYQGVKRG